MNAPPIPPFLLSKATARGIPAAEVPDLWAQHWERAQSEGREAGGVQWDRFCEAVAVGLKDRTTLSRAEGEKAEETLRRRRLDRQAKRAADAAYDAASVSLEDHLADLRRLRADGVTELSLHEEAMADAPAPYAGECFESWMLRILAGLPSRRANECPTLVDNGQACGMACERWARDGKVYEGGRCVEHAMVGQ